MKKIPGGARSGPKRFALGAATITSHNLTKVSDLLSSTYLVNTNSGSSTSAAATRQALPPSGVGLLTNEHELCAQLIKSGIAEDCSPNYVVTVDPKPLGSPNDPRYWYNQASYDAIAAEQAWALLEGRSDIQPVVVGVVDTGVDYTHYDIAGSMWSNPGEVPGNGIDDDRNGYVDDTGGWNSSGLFDLTGFTDNGNIYDDHSHGTHCAGIIAAARNNGIGIAGVSPNAKIMPLKFMDRLGRGSTFGAIRAIEYAIRAKKRGVNVRVLSNSYGGAGFSFAFEDVIKAARAEGILVVAAAGNDSSNNDVSPSYPASYDGVISVASVRQGSGELSSFSSYGPATVQIAAPGDGITSTIPNQGYATYSGTSMATPFVAGALALLLGAEPNLSAADAKERLLSSGAWKVDLDGLTTSGRQLNLYNLIANVRPPGYSGPVYGYVLNKIPYVDVDLRPTGDKILPYPNSPSIRRDVRIPFAFPFFSRQYMFPIISANGMIDFGSDYIRWDTDNLPMPLTKSIAVFQTFFAARPLFDWPWELPADQGVWVKSNPAQSEWAVQWRLPPRGDQNLGVVTATAILKENGTIRLYSSFSDPKALRAIGNNTLIGVRELPAANSLVISYMGYPYQIGMQNGFELVGPTRTDGPGGIPLPTPLATTTPSATATPTASSTNTPTPTPSPIATLIATSTATAIPSATAAPSATPSPTRTPTATASPTSTASPSPTSSPTSTATATPTRSPTATPPTQALSGLSLLDERGRPGTIRSGARFILEIKANQAGPLSLELFVGEKKCPESLTRNITGAQSLSGTLPSLGPDFSSVRLRSGNIETSAKVRAGTGRGAIKALAPACAAVQRSILRATTSSNRERR